MCDKKNYWDVFYYKEIPPQYPSTFSKYILSYIDDKNSLLDIGCGNGRDSLFFKENGFDVISIDNAKSIDFLGDTNKFHVVDVIDTNFKVDVYYARFFIHVIKESMLNSFFENLSNIMSKNSIFVFETRSTKGITELEKKETNFKSSVGEKHFRMLYSKKYIKTKLIKYFDVIHLIEENNVAIHKEDNPYVIRGIVKKI